jgi:2-haloacid dehalogenase
MSGDHPGALLFDVFGTVVDWRTSVIRELRAFGEVQELRADWPRIADDWRGEYQPAMEEVRSGRREWTILDVLHRESVERVLGHHGITAVPGPDLDHLATAWHRLDPWTDAVPALTLLKERFIVGTLSNGNVGLLTRLAKHAGLPWDVILCAETARAYKPLPEAYLRNVALLNLPPGEVMLVAAHNGDLRAAADAGLRTAFVPRPQEHGPAQTADLEPTGAWDVVAPDLVSLARAMGA